MGRNETCAQPLAREVETHARAPVVVMRLHDDRRPIRPHAVTHAHFVLVYHTSGETRMDVRGAWTLREGDVLLVPAGEPHHMIESRAAVRWGLALCRTCFDGDGDELLFEPFERVRSGSAAVVRIPEARRAFFASLFEELERECAEGASASRAVQRSLVTLLTTELVRAMGAEKSGATGDLVADALRYVEKNAREPISLRDVASAMRRSPAHLTTVVRKTTGRSIGAWITLHRLADARARLVHSDELVEVIAERVGYGDVTHFIRAFRKAHGMTPTAWRTSQRGASTRVDD